MSRLLLDGYQEIPNLISIEEAKKIKEYDYNLLIRDKVLIEYDIGRGSVYTGYRPKSTSFIMKRLKPILEKMVGEELLPSYWFTTIYHGNSFMHNHTDRPSCEISVSLNIHSEQDWPLYFENLNKNYIGCVTRIGQAVAYLGSECKHWREPLESRIFGERYMQSFFHFVRKNGEYADYKYDKFKHSKSLDNCYAINTNKSLTQKQFIMNMDKARWID
tara:strand:- start:106 stop:756 length:651 start_codon:yes stop_codon:yes gene_type:complete